MPLDLSFVRKQFPSKRWDWAFFENAGGAFVPNTVIEQMRSYMSEAQVQIGHTFPTSVDATQRMNRGHQTIAEFIGADVDEVTIAASTSINVYVLAQALRGLWQPGDEIIVTSLNHEANSGPWRALAEFGLKIIDWPVVADTAQLDIEALDSLLSDKTRLVAFPHVSNITGDINDVKAITQQVHDAGAMVCVDGVAYAPHRAVDVKDWDVDFYLFSLYKVFGPHLGCLYGKQEHLRKAKGQYHYFFEEDDLGHKFNPAGPNHESIACLTGVAEYLDALSSHHFSTLEPDFYSRTKNLFQLIAEHEGALAEQFLDFVKQQKRIRLIGTTDSSMTARAPTFSFLIDGIQAESVPLAALNDKVAISSGHFYSKRLLDELQIPNSAVVRCSMAHYNSKDDVDRLIHCLEKLL